MQYTAHSSGMLAWGRCLASQRRNVSDVFFVAHSYPCTPKRPELNNSYCEHWRDFIDNALEKVDSVLTALVYEMKKVKPQS
jgi:hypothetical protein